MSARLIPLDDVDESLIANWRQLGQLAVEPNAFAEADFVMAAHRWLGWSRRAGVVVVERGGELRFVMPVAQVRHFRHIPVPALAAWTHPYCFSGTPLTSPRDLEGSWAEALEVMRTRAPWSVLEHMGSGGPVMAALSRVQVDRGRKLTSLPLADRFVLHRRAEGGTYLDRLGASRRSKVRRLRSRLEAAFDIDVVDHAAPGEDLGRAVDGFLAMEAAGWKGADGGAMACHPGHAAFFRDICQKFAAAGSLQLRVLRADRAPIAYQCNFVVGDTMFGFKTTYDESLRRYSPGVMLLVETIFQFESDERLRHYDSCMGPGQGTVRDLFLDRSEQADLLVALRGHLGWAATALTPQVANVYRRAKGAWASARLRPSAPATPPPGSTGPVTS